MKYVILICCLLSFTLCAKEIKNITVLDGDTISYVSNDKRIRVRLYAIDAPEKDQPFGINSKEYLQQCIENKLVEIIVITEDKYAREIALLYANGKCINSEMVLCGYAWYYPSTKPVSNSFRYHEQYAKEKKLGLWKTKNPQEPWVWRSEHK